MNQNDKIEVMVEGVGKEILTQQNYVATGGEGTVYQKGGTAYKIMLPGKNVIPRTKMQELGKIQANNVLIPQRHLLDSKGTPIGITMRYVQDIEFLCKLFNIGFRQKKGYSNKDAVELVKELQLTLQKIHDARILVVDFNQMNFLVDGKTMKIPYFIDTDSYQTPSFKATALMESVRDRKTTKGQFSIFTDWYSWGIVTFWIYIGTHPYRGSHPSYNNNDWCTKRMDDGVSVFDHNVVMPANCYDFSVIPKAHLEWYKGVFSKGDRSVPPLADGQIVIAVGIRVKDVAQFLVRLIMKYDSPIRRVDEISGNRYVLTNQMLWKDATPVFKYSDKYDDIAMLSCDEGNPVMVMYNNKKLTVYDWAKKETLHEIEADDFMAIGGKVYTRSQNKLIEHSCSRIYDKIIHSVKEVADIFGSACKLFDGVAVQDVIGKARLAIRNENGSFVNLPVPELDGLRVTDAKCVNQYCVVVGEKAGKVSRYIFNFSGGRSTYNVRKEDANAGDSADFVIKPNGLCISPVSGDDLETWTGDQSKVFKKGPIPTGAIMYTEKAQTMFALDDSLYVTEKKP